MYAYQDEIHGPRRSFLIGENVPPDLQCPSRNASNLIINIPAHTYIPLAIGFILVGVNLRKIPSRPMVIRQPHYFSRRRTICSRKFAGPMREREPNILRTVEPVQSENARAINVALPGLWLSATIYTYCVSVR
jgi:hypothetical protein